MMGLEPLPSFEIALFERLSFVPSGETADFEEVNEDYGGAIEDTARHLWIADIAPNHLDAPGPDLRPQNWTVFG